MNRKPRFRTPPAFRIGVLLVGLALWPLRISIPSFDFISDNSLERAIQEVRAKFEDGRYQEAHLKGLGLLEWVESSFGTDSLQTAEVLDLLVLTQLHYGEAPAFDAEQLARRALGIKQGLLPADHPGLGDSLSGLSRVLMCKGEVEKALPLLDQVLRIRSTTFGSESPEVAEVLVLAGRCRQQKRDYRGASLDLERALSIMERTRSGDRGLALLSLGVLARELGEYEDAKEYAVRSLQFREGALRVNHPEIAKSLTLLALAMADTGDLAGGIEMDRKALAIRRRCLEHEVCDVGSSLLNLGIKLADLGDYASAYSMTEESSRMGLAINGPNHPSAAHGVSSLGEILRRMGRYPEAASMLEESIRIKERVNGPEDGKLVTSLTALARVRIATGDYEEAQRHLERARVIALKTYGPDHPGLSSVLNQLADLAIRQGKLRLARDLAASALRVQELGLGREHPGTAESLVALAQVARAQNRPAETLTLSLEANSLVRQHLRRAAQGLSEREALRYESVRALGLDLAIGAILQSPGVEGFPDAVRVVWDEQIRSRALVLDEIVSRHRRILDSEDPRSLELVDQLERKQNRLARLAQGIPGSMQAKGLSEEVRAAREEEEQAERALGAVSSRFRELRRKEEAGFAEVHKALPPGSALVSFIQFHNGTTGVPMSAELGESTAKTDKAYAALVMSRGAESPRVISLGPIQPIDRLVRRWRNAVSLEPADAGEAVATLNLGRELRRRIWDPVAKELAAVDSAFVVPEGALNLVNFAALPTEGDRYLLETGPLLHYLSAERDLLLSDHAPARGNELLALGGPDFDAGGGAGKGTPSLLASLLRGPTSECGDFRSLRFKPLPNALAEVEEVASLWTATTPGKSVVRLTGGDASEGAFKRQAPGKRVLHLATHGFFLDDRCQSSLRNAESGSPRGVGFAEEALRGETPLVLSGLAMAGANRRDDPAQRQEGEDGILTAAEVASLDLRGVEWAVLSACGTGVGPVQAGEGVLGLRRAFQVAGAQTIIMSLWEVGDLPAREWIHQLYLGKLSGLTTAQSVRRASLEMLKARRKANVTTHPFYWGAFIASGDWH